MEKFILVEIQKNERKRFNKTKKWKNWKNQKGTNPKNGIFEKKLKTKTIWKNSKNKKLRKYEHFDKIKKWKILKKCPKITKEFEKSKN